MADKITEIVGQEAYAQIDRLKNDMKELQLQFESSAKVAVLMNSALSSTKGIKDVSNAIKQQSNELTNIQKLQQRFIHQTTETARVEADLRVRIQELTMANKDLARSEKAKEGSIASMRLELKGLQIQYDNLAKAEREAGKGTTLLKHLKDVDTELKKLEAGSGRFQRNVGNYASGWSPLSNAMGQITRELPNFGQSLQVGVLSLTNNIGALQDAVKGIRTQNALLKSEGKATTSVLSQIGGAILSWNTLLYVAIGLFSAYSKEIGEFVSNLFKGVDGLNKFNEAILEGTKNAVSETNELKRLYERTQDVTLSIEQRKKAVDELQKQYPSYFANITDENILNGKSIETYLHLRDAIIETAKAKAVKEKIDNIVSDGMEQELFLIDLQNKAIEKYNKLKGKSVATQGFGAGSFSTKSLQAETDKERLNAVKEAEKALSDFRNNQNKKLRVYEDYLKTSSEIVDKYGDPYTGKEKKNSSKKEAEINRINDLKKQYEREQTELQISFDKKQITEEEFYYKSIQLTTKYHDKRKGLNVKEIESEKDFNLELDKNATDLHNKLLSNSLKELETTNYVYGQQEKLAIKKYDFISKMADEDLKKNKARLEEEYKQAKEKNDKLEAMQQASNKLTQDSINAGSDIAITITDRLIYEVNRKSDIELKAIDEKEKAELEALERMTLSDKDRAERKKRIEIEAEARRKATERERIKDLRKYAIIQKNIDIGQIIANTAIAIMSALSMKAPLAVKALTAVSYGVTGAAQLAKVIATPLPQYAEGVESTPNDSMAIVGERGTELVTEKSGKQWLTPSTDTLTFLPKGTKVTPHRELMANVYDNAHKYMLGSPITTDTMQNALLQSFEELYNRVDNLTEIMASKNMNVSIFGDFEHAMRIKKSRM